MLLRNSRKASLRLALIAASLGIFLAGYYWGNRYQFGRPAPAAISGILVRPPAPLPPFELRDQDQLSFTDGNLSGHWSLAAFGALPRAESHQAITRLIQVYNRLADYPTLHQELFLVVFATSGDRAAAADFARLSPALKLLSGDAHQLALLQAFFGYGSTDAERHGILYLIDPQVQMRALFSSQQEAAAVAEDIKAIAANHTETPSHADE